MDMMDVHVEAQVFPLIVDYHWFPYWWSVNDCLSQSSLMGGCGDVIRSVHKRVYMEFVDMMREAGIEAPIGLGLQFKVSMYVVEGGWT